MDTPKLPTLHTDSANRVNLTDDVLCEIYYILADIDPPRGPKIKWYSQTGTLGWIVLTHVCRQWRYVGINLAALWARITCVFPPDINTILDRTKDAPLTVDLQDSNNSHNRWLDVDFLERLVVRARTYMSDTDKFQSTRPLRSVRISESWCTLFAGRTLPTLQTLELTFDPEEYEPLIAEKYLDAPALRSLTTNVPRPIVAPHLSSLYCEHGSHWHWRLLLDFIRLFPLLEQLFIPGIDSDMDRWPPNEKEIALMLERAREPNSVQLSRIKTLELAYYGPRAHELLQRLEIPSSASLKVYAVRDESLWKKILSRPEMAQKAHRFLSVFEVWDEYYDNVWKLALTKKPICLPTTEDIVDADGSIMTAVTDSSKAPNLLDTVPSQVARNIEELVLGHGCGGCDCERSYQPLDYGRLSVSLARFSNVTALHLYCLHEDTILSPASHHLFPKLRTVVLTCSDYNPTEDMWWDCLRGFLSARKEADRQLGCLVFRGDALCHTACFNHQISDEEWNLLSDEEFNDMLDACLQRRRIDLELQAPLVGEIVDERSAEKCSCRDRCSLIRW